MPDAEVSTGNKTLDEDRRVLLTLLDGPGLQQLEEGIADDTLSTEDFARLLPESAFLLAGALGNPANFQLIQDGLTEQGREILHALRRTVEDRLDNVLRSAPSVKRLRDIHDRKPDPSAKSSSLAQSFRVIKRVQRIHLWFGEHGKLQPAVRLGLISGGDDLALDTTLPLGDLCFVAQVLAEVVSEALDRARPFHESGSLELGDTDDLAKHLRKLEEHVKTVMDHAQSLGILQETDERSEAEEVQDTCQEASETS